MRAFIVVLDSVGIGAAPDAADYGDAGANTLGHLADTVGWLHVPTLESMGLGLIPPLLPSGMTIRGVSEPAKAKASYGAMREMSKGKDTTTGHWEIAGLLMNKGFHVFPKEFPSFPAELIAEFERRTGRKTLGNKAASGTAIIEELGPRQMETGEWIVYTSADSVFQIAAHEAVIPLQELYDGCRVARELCDAYTVGRVIARPYVGLRGEFHRTENRRDFSYPLPEPTVLDKLYGHGIGVITVGKLDDIFSNRGITERFHVENNSDAQSAVLALADRPGSFLCFANLIDFDMLYGHRRNPHGYAAALEEADTFLGELVSRLTPDDVLVITADHGNDPTFRGTDHTREYVPLLVFQPNRPARSLGIRDGFYDIAQSMASFFGVPPMPRGVSFLSC